MPYVVEQVDLGAGGDERLDGFELERPQAGERGDLHVLQIEGAADAPLDAQAVEVVYHGRAIQAAPVRNGRWRVLVGLVGLRRDAELALDVVLANGDRVPAASMKLARTPLRSGFAARLQPLVLSSLGRSGSTWMMKVFASHPEIVVRRHFPYESSAAKYWMHALRVLSDPANLMQSAHPDTFNSNRWWAGNNPYYDASAIEHPERAAWLAGEHVERLARFFQESVEQWYESVASSQEQRDPRYFAEKHLWPDFLPMLIRELYPGAREVFLVRDFRDVACSALRMDERRGFPGFGREADMSEEDYVRVVVRRMATDITRSWAARREGAHLVRYEDMVRQPGETVSGVLSYLGVDASPGTVERVVELASEDLPALPGTTFDPALVETHRSPRAGEASIGGWRERSDSFQAALDEALGEALDAFGYERDGAPDGRAHVRDGEGAPVHSEADGAPADTFRRQG